MGRPYKCPSCGESGRSVSKGVRRTKTQGDRRIRLCKACGRKFTPKNQKPGESPDAAEPQAAKGDQVAVEVTPAVGSPVTAAKAPQVSAHEPQSQGAEVSKPDGHAA